VNDLAMVKGIGEKTIKKNRKDILLKKHFSM
jgi:DNA uptake protein ComE-like DNA-binding protein